MKQLPLIEQAFSEWYNEVIYLAELVDQSPVRGSMVVRPYGCALWEQMVKQLDVRIKVTGHSNALFPLFIPESFLKKEADHIEGFAPELAVVTHAGGEELEESLVVRPTSETIIHYMFARWIKSWRDLPLKINQWANVVRWEMRPRPFLRTTEFYWQEGHTAHATWKEAYEEVQLMLNEYIAFCHEYLAIPVIAGQKTEQEKFPGAEITLTFEGIMQDGKALQMGTSHLLSQSFAHAFEIKFQDKDGVQKYPFLTSWGATTRLVGAVVMVHGDQKGLVLPPKIAPIQVVIIPILKKNNDSSALMAAVAYMQKAFADSHIRCTVDDNVTKTPGAKFYEWELKGVPVRIEIGERDLAQSMATIVTRLGKKEQVQLASIIASIESLLIEVQEQLFEKAQQKRDQQIVLKEKLFPFDQEIGTLPYKTSWCLNKVCESALKEKSLSIRCILTSDASILFRDCFYCNEKAQVNVIVAKSY